MGSFNVDRGFASYVIVAGAIVTALGCGDADTRTGDSPTGGSGAGVGGVGGAGVGGVGGIAGIGATGGTGGSAGDVGGTGGVAGDVGGTGGVAGTGGSGGVAGTGGAGGSGGVASAPKCLESDSQVIVIGDSYINWVSHTMPQDLVTVSQQNWRMYAIGAASMASGGLSSIPAQFEQAVTADPNITTVVMTGGGNDILVPDGGMAGSAECKNSMNAASMPVCQTIVQLAVDKAIELMDRAAEVGVKDVIYFFYPEVPEGTLIGGLYPRTILNYALPLVRDTCTSAEMRTGGKLKCHFIDTIPLFRGHDDWFAFADIHENSLGSMAIAREVWSVMQDECIAQKSTNSCCEP